MKETEVRNELRIKTIQMQQENDKENYKCRRKQRDKHKNQVIQVEHNYNKKEICNFHGEVKKKKKKELTRPGWELVMMSR